MADIAVAGRDISKRFATHAQRATSLKERLVRRTGDSPRTEFWALRDVNLDVHVGESVALMGANGSGKSTLLKVLAGIIRPTQGTVESHGRIASLLELGAGFNGELSGRENIYLNASLLGLSRRETTALFDDIVEFSELQEFIDAPVKHYSSGMYVRLGFAVAVHVDPDILLVDEVLAVGDEHFQRKCLEKILEFQEQGRTILFVSHSSALVEKVCTRAVVLDHGRQVFDGDPEFATAELSKLLGTDRPTIVPDIVEGTDLSFTDVVFSARPGGAAITSVAPGDPLSVRVHAEVGAHWVDQIERARLIIMGVGDIPIWTMSMTRDQLPDKPGTWELDFAVEHCPPLRGRFAAAIQLLQDSGDLVGIHRTSHAFKVTGDHKVGILRVPFTADARAVGIS